MKLRAVKLLRLAALAVQTEIGGGLMPRINRALRIAPLALCAALVLGSAGMANAETASLYVQDGLIACWDGIENAGVGVHNPSATVWKDLVAGREFSLQNVTVNADRMTFAGSASSYGTLSAADTTATFVAANSGTMEIVYASRDGDAKQVLIQAPEASRLMFGWSYLTDGTYYIIPFAGSDKKPTFAFSSGTATNSVSVRYTSGVPDSAVGNGLPLASSEANYWRTEGSKTIIGTRADKSGYHFPGSIYCIRLYNRKLTDEEVSANHEVDDMRFKYGLNDKCLEVMGVPIAIGSPSPAYGVTNGLAASDSFIVSCGTTPVMDAVGRLQYSCTGWKLYDETDAVVSSGDGTSFTYIHPNPAAYRRLEWQWELTASYSETWYNTRVNYGNDTAEAGTCLVGNPGLWTNSVGEAGTQFYTNDTYVVSGGQRLRMGNVAGLRRFAGGTMQFGRNGTTGKLYYDSFYALSFPYGLILDCGSINYSYYNNPEQARIGGVLNGGMITVTASEQNPFSMSAPENRIVVINNDLATESDSNVLSIGGSAVKCVYFIMGDLSGYTGRIVANCTSSSDVRWATRLCLGNRTMPGTIQVKGKAAISAWSGVKTNPGNALDLPTCSPSVCTIGSLQMESNSVIRVEGRNEDTTLALAATNGLIRVSTAFSAIRPVYVQPSWAVEVTKENPDVTVLTVPASQELSKADFKLDTTGLELPEDLILEVVGVGSVKKLVITKKKKGFAIIVR